MGLIIMDKFGYFFKLILPGVNKIILLENLCIISIEKKWLLIIIKILHTNFNFCMSSLLDIWCVDYPDRLNRFELNYLLCSYKYNYRVIVRVNLAEDSVIDSLSVYFSSACWLEREIWDMFGVYFTNNVDLRRILTDYGFDGYPLRKDFPLSGFVELRYDDSSKIIMQEILEVSQEYRMFNFKSPWEKL